MHNVIVGTGPADDTAAAVDQVSALQPAQWADADRELVTVQPAEPRRLAGDLLDLGRRLSRFGEATFSTSLPKFDGDVFCRERLPDHPRVVSAGLRSYSNGPFRFPGNHPPQVLAC